MTNVLKNKKIPFVHTFKHIFYIKGFPVYNKIYYTKNRLKIFAPIVVYWSLLTNKRLFKLLGHN